jgi:hypothetical protein
VKNDVNIASKSNKQRKLILVAIFKVTYENNRIRIRKSEVQISGSGSAPKCQGSATPLTMYGTGGFYEVSYEEAQISVRKPAHCLYRNNVPEVIPKKCTPLERVKNAKILNQSFFNISYSGPQTF